MVHVSQSISNWFFSDRLGLCSLHLKKEEMVIVLHFPASTLRLISYAILHYRLTNQIVYLLHFFLKSLYLRKHFRCWAFPNYYNFLYWTIIKVLSCYGLSLTPCWSLELGSIVSFWISKEALYQRFNLYFASATQV